MVIRKIRRGEEVTKRIFESGIAPIVAGIIQKDLRIFLKPADCHFAIWEIKRHGTVHRQILVYHSSKEEKPIMTLGLDSTPGLLGMLLSKKQHEVINEILSGEMAVTAN